MVNMSDPDNGSRDADVSAMQASEPPGNKADGAVGLVLEERYELQSELGRGGMGVVYKGWHRLMERPVAVKMLHAHLITDERQLLQIRSEARLIAELDHPNIVHVHAFGTTPQGAPYLVMEFLEGEPLSAVLVREKSLSNERTIELMLQVANGLAFLHEKGIVHRDLKPKNIVVNYDEKGAERVSIVDFGIARRDEQSHTITQVVGTPSYMSPEQCLGKRGTIQGDLYSLGCVLYECLSGQPPFLGESALDTLRMQVSEPPPPLKLLRANIPVALQNITLKLLAKQPDERYQSALALMEDLTALQKSLSGKGPEPSIQVPRFAPKAGSIGGKKLTAWTLVVVLGLVVAGMLGQRFLPEEDTLFKPKTAQVDDSPESPDTDADDRFLKYCQRLGQVPEGESPGQLPELMESALLEMQDPQTRRPRMHKQEKIKTAQNREQLACRYFLLSNRPDKAAYHANVAASYSDVLEGDSRSINYIESMCMFARACLSARQPDKALQALDLAENVFPQPPPNYHVLDHIAPIRMQAYWQKKLFERALDIARETTAVKMTPAHDAECQALMLQALNKCKRFNDTIKDTGC